MRLIIFSAASAIVPVLILCSATRAEEPNNPSIGPRPFTLGDVARAGTRLKDPDAAKAAQAARELGESRQPAAAPLLLALYSDGDGERRIEAVKALGMLKEGPIPNRFDFKEWSEKKRSETFQSIALGDISLAIRRAGAAELARGERLTAALKFFMDASVNVKAYTAIHRNRAVHHAGQLGGSLASAFLREQLGSTESEIVIAAAEELGELPELPNADALIRALASTRPEFKTAARAALERMSGKNYQYDLVKWAEWRASVRGNPFRESASTISGSDDSPRQPPPEVPPVDIAIAFDTTASFLHTWAQVDQALDAVLRELAKSDPPPRLGLVRYRAIDARVALKYAVQATPLTFEFDTVQKELKVASFGGGSGALHEGLRYALNGLAWRDRSRKIIIVIGDDSPNSQVEDAMKIALQLTRDAALLDNIQVNTLYAKTTAGEENRVTYRKIAEAGIGRFYEFNKAERHLVDMGAATVNVKNTELPAETARKWITPRGK